MRTLRFNLYGASAVLVLLAAGLAAGCATPVTDPVQLSCAQLHKEIRATEQARQGAVEKYEDPFSWVIPFAAGGVPVASKSAISSADRWLDQLRDESRAKGCARNA